MKIILLANLFFISILILKYDKAPESIVKIQITDARDLALINAQIFLKKKETIMYSGFTDSKGVKSFSLTYGTYFLSIIKPGFTQLVDKEIIINQPNHNFTYGLTSLIPIDDNNKEYTIPKIDGKLDISKNAYASMSKSSNSGLPKSGQITAGEWNDLHNWKLWEDLLNQEEYQEMESFWGIFTKQRYSVTVLNKQNIPLPNVTVNLLDDENNTIWRGLSDLSGKVELWDGAFSTVLSGKKIIASADNVSYSILTLNEVSQGSNIIIIDAPCKTEPLVDIAFVVDATSSMKDEIKYLQSELMDVIENVESLGKHVRWSSLFYRDHNEEYLTKISDFSENKEDILEFIRGQSADGGGDYPEEVSEALFQGVHNLNWNNKADVKLMFLVLDAPPHDNPLSLKKYRHAVKDAAEMGIKIIPITASGINRYSEFLMKFSAILTNGTYVFITDDSGIGHGHLDPVVSDFDVETLNNLIIRLIQNYSAAVGCEVSETYSNWQGKIYPNPASDYLNIDEVIEGDLLQIISSSGMVVKSLLVQDEKIARMNVALLTPGSYFIKMTRNGEVLTRRVIIIR